MQQAQFFVHDLDIYMEIAQNTDTNNCPHTAYNEYFYIKIVNIPQRCFFFDHIALFYLSDIVENRSPQAIDIFQ